MSIPTPLRVSVPGESYHRELISCQVACPVHTDARGYVRAIAAGRFGDAYLIARGPNPLAFICGRICGAPCEAACRRGKVPRVDADGCFVAQDRPIAIRALKRFACEQSGAEARPAAELLAMLRETAIAGRGTGFQPVSYSDRLEACPAPLTPGPSPTRGEGRVPSESTDAEEMAALLRAGVSGQFVPAAGEPIAIVGAGPAGLAAAHDLALMGFRPVVFETERVAAGMLVLGVPAYRLPRDLIRREVAVIEALGVEIRCGVTVGRDVSLAELRRDHAAVLIAVGAKSSRSLGLPGERGPGVFGGVDLLRALALDEPIEIGHDVVVLGGGNVAYDVARTVVRQIAYDTARTAARLEGTGSVHLVSLETLEEMPADTVEIVEGDEEGVQRLGGWGPVAIERDAAGAVAGVTLRRCLRVYDENRRFAPLFDDAQRQTLPCDTVLLAVGQSTDLALLDDGGADIELARPGWIKVDPETLATTAPGVFVAGDLAHGTRLLIDAVASGKKAARSVYRFVTGRSLEAEAATAHWPLDGYRREPGYEAISRVPVSTVEPAERLSHPDVVVERGYAPSEAIREASRCLDCGVSPVFDGTRCVLCGGCVDVCPTQCLKLVGLSEIERSEELGSLVDRSVGAGADWSEHSAILKDEDRCIRCAACAMRCPTEAITMERVACASQWRTV